jgi:hypothetical protein
MREGKWVRSSDYRTRACAGIGLEVNEGIGGGGSECVLSHPFRKKTRNGGGTQFLLLSLKKLCGDGRVS